jgi:hypothetical protein
MSATFAESKKQKVESRNLHFEGGGSSILS